MMGTYVEDKARGAAAFRAGDPFDERESPGWIVGYGDEITIETIPAVPPLCPTCGGGPFADYACACKAEPPSYVEGLGPLI